MNVSSQPYQHNTFDHSAEFQRLVRFCAGVTRNWQVAEDLAQETLLEAVRNQHKLHDPAGRERWLLAIARHVCHRWARRAGHDRLTVTSTDAIAAATDPSDLETDVEQRELAELLQRALEHLPDATRQTLVASELAGRSHADIARQLGVRESAVAMRVSRGKRQLRSLIATEFAGEAASYGLAAPETGGWQELRIWCLICGQRRLWMRLQPAPGTVAFRCAGCHGDRSSNAAEYSLANRYFAELLGTRQRPLGILSATAHWCQTYFRQALDRNVAQCINCGQRVLVERRMKPDHMVAEPARTVVIVTCDHCGEACSTSFAGFVSTHPAVQSFWRSQRRVTLLSHTEVSRSELVSRFVSRTSPAMLDVVSDPVTFAVLRIVPSVSAAS